jgi:hypothetical protein
LTCETWGCSRTNRQGLQDYSKTSCSTTKYSEACRTDIPGPTTQAGTRPTTAWALGTTRLGIHGARWRGAQGHPRASTRIGN